MPSKFLEKFLYLLIFLIVNVACKSNNDGVVGKCMCLYLFNRLSIFLYFSTILCHIFHIFALIPARKLQQLVKIHRKVKKPLL